MSQYATPQETASVFRKATPNELWLHEQLDRVNPERHEMGSAGDTQALTILVFELRRDVQRLTGEAKVLRDLLKLTIPTIETMMPEADHPSGEHVALSELLGQIDAALRGTS